MWNTSQKKQRMPISMTTRRIPLARHDRVTSCAISPSTFRKHQMVLSNRMESIETELYTLNKMLEEILQDYSRLGNVLNMMYDENNNLQKKHDSLLQELEDSNSYSITLRMHLENRDNTLMFMTHKMDELQSQMSLLLQDRETEHSDDVEAIICQLCCEICEKHKVSWCENPSSPHAICHTCLNKTFQAKNNNPCLNLEKEVLCLSLHEECVHPMQGVSAVPEGLKFLYNKAASLTMKHASTLIHDTMKNCDQMDELLVRLNHMQFDGTFRGFACGRCGFGPMWNEHCDDLIMHHNQDTGTTSINNACPGCGLFTRSVHYMKRWDGTMKAENNGKTEEKH